MADRRTPRPSGSGGSPRPSRASGSGKPAGGKPGGGKPGGGKPGGGKPAGGKPAGGRPAGGKPRGGTPARGKPASGRPAGERPRSDSWGSDKPRSDRPRSDRPAGDRPRSDSWGSDKPRSDRPAGDRPAGDRPRSDRPRSDNQRTDRYIPDRPLSDRPRDPHIPDEITAEQLDRSVLLELRTLPDGLAEIVARHLVAADLAMADDDVELAMAHIEAARRRAGRVAAVREAAGVAAYKAGKFSEAISELRTARRMTGSNSFIPMIADCERGLGRPQKALDLIRATNTKTLDDETRSELLIVGAGARADLGQISAAIITLQVPELTKLRPGTARARLQYAYSDFLAQVGRTTEAWEWMERAAASDIDGATDAAERCEEFAGIAFTEEIGSDPAND